MRLIPDRDRQLAYRRRAADALARAATRLHDQEQFVGITHLPVDPDRPRWGHGRPSNPHLEQVIAAGVEQYRTSLSSFAAYRDELAKIRRDGPEPGEPHLRNHWIPGGDAVALYGLVRSLAPRRYVEVGSGISTLYAHRARRDGATGTIITSIDPFPRTDVDEVCDTVIRSPLETADLGLFFQLQSGDVVFIDNSHHALMNSDVATFFFDVLPLLPPGVTVGIHDIYLPDDYPRGWGELQFSEQYVLAGLLLAGQHWWEPVYATWWVSNQPRLMELLEPIWQLPNMDGVQTSGTSFWFRTAGGLP